jgi:hypothetical protein
MSYFFEELQVGEIIHIQFRGGEEQNYHYCKIDFIILDVTKKGNILTREEDNGVDIYRIKHDLTFLIKPLSSNNEELLHGKLWIRYEENNISNVVVTFGVGVNQFSRKVDRMEKVFSPENE